MNIFNKTYCLKNQNEQEFEEIYKNSFPISYIEVGNGRIVFASRNEVFLKTKNKIRKLANFSTDVTSLSMYDCFICIGAGDGTVRVFTDYRESVFWNKDYGTIIRDIGIYSLNKNEEMRLVSCGNDGIVKFYTFFQKNPIHMINFKNNYISALEFCGDKLVIVSNSIGVYDLNTYEICFEYNHKTEISGVIVLDTHLLCFSSKNKLYLLDIEKESILEKTIHVGRILKMIFYENVIYTLSKDGHLKSFTENLDPISDFYFKNKPNSFSIFDGQPYIAFEDGQIMTTKLKKNNFKLSVNKNDQREYKKKPYDDTFDYDLISSNKKHLTNIDRMLKSYRYKDALKEIMKETNKETIFGVLKYINEMKSLKTALKDGNEDFVIDFLNFCLYYFRIHEFKFVLIDCLTIVLSVYNDMFVESKKLIKKIEELSKIIDEDVLFEQNLLQTIGFLESF